MAEEILTQEEISVLLKFLERERRELGQEGKEIRPLYIEYFERISAGRIPGLELIFERWIGGLRKGLTSVIASIPNVYKENIALVRFSDLIAKLPVPCVIGLFNIEPFKGTSLLYLDTRLVYMTVNNVFGGSIRSFRVESKDFTRIELKIAQRLLNVSYKELESAWNTVMDVRVNPVGIETNPTLLTIARPREKYIVVELNVSIEGSEGRLLLAIPEESIAPYKELLKGVAEVRSKDLEQSMIGVAKGIPVNLEVILGSVKLSFRQLLELKEGDIITLNRLVKEPLEVRVQGLPKIEAFLGQVGKQRAMKVNRYVEKEEQDGGRKEG